jgi:hypothetical protein
MCLAKRSGLYLKIEKGQEKTETEMERLGEESGSLFDNSAVPYQ